MGEWTFRRGNGRDVIVNRYGDDVESVDAGHGPTVLELMARFDRAATRRRHTEQARVLATIRALPGYRELT